MYLDKIALYSGNRIIHTHTSMWANYRVNFKPAGAYSYQSI